jgi:hypothetical protein
MGLLSESFGGAVINMTLSYQTSRFTSPATYSNLANHPRLLRLKQEPSTKRIVLDKKAFLQS